MTNRTRLSYLLAASLVLGIGLLAFPAAISKSIAADEPAKLSAQVTKPKAAPAPPRYQGVASCGSSGCHQANGPMGSKGSEYSTWITHDPHAKAFTVLYETSAKVMEKNYRKLPDLKSAKPESDSLCLKCHALNAAAGRRGERFDLIDGVSCEVCHGAAENWLAQHYLDSWQKLDGQQKKALGFTPTKNLVSRIQVCVDCHVGAPGMEVNHDLIAAGHPRLNFEFAAYLANYPKHWAPKADDLASNFEAKAWVVGQVLSAEAAINLLAARAREATLETAPWPEFAEYDCFACHHGLRDEKWRRDRDFAKRAPGSFPWQTWYVAIFPELAKRFPGPEATKALQSMMAVDALMSLASPPAARIADQAAAAKSALHAWAEQLATDPFSENTLRTLLKDLALDKEKLASGSWDSSTQLYLGMVALQQACSRTAPRPADAQVYTHLREMLNGLVYPKEFNSPTGFAPEKLETPLKEIRKLVAP